MLYQLGLGEAHIEGALKEVPCELLGGKTPRYAMQTLGTEWGRDTDQQDAVGGRLAPRGGDAAGLGLRRGDRRLPV